MSKVYGYCRISRKTQNIERQIRNILQAYPDAVIFKEDYTGTRFDGRKQFERMRKLVKPDDTIVFDSVSRMSRNADEGIAMYEELYQQGIHLVYLKEHHIDTATYDKALHDGVPMTGTNVDVILQAINEYLRILRREQIVLAFEQAQKEVDDLHQRTREGIETARLAGKQIGRKKEVRPIMKMEAPAKAIILKHSKDFNGTLDDSDVITLAKVSRNTYYKYKRELRIDALSE